MSAILGNVSMPRSIKIGTQVSRQLLRKQYSTSGWTDRYIWSSSWVLRESSAAKRAQSSVNLNNYSFTTGRFLSSTPRQLTSEDSDALLCTTINRRLLILKRTSNVYVI